MYLSYSQNPIELAGYTVKENNTYNNYTHSENIYNGYAYGRYIEYANVFTAKGNETLSEVCFYIDSIPAHFYRF